MDLRHLHYFVSVAREGQFVRAARRLHVAQSALSQQIRALEREVGAELLIRDRRGIRLTAAGAVLERHATRILTAVDDARAELQQLTGLLAGRLHIGAGAPTGPVRLAHALEGFRAAHPGVEVKVSDASTDELLRKLGAGEIDAAVVSTVPELLSDDLDGLLIARERFVALVPPGHRLAARRRLRLAELEREPIVTYARGAGIRAAVDAALADAGIAAASIAAETMDSTMLLDLVRHGLGVAIVPRSFAELAGDLPAARLVGTSLERPRTLAWARERRASPALAAFLDFAPAALRIPTAQAASRDAPTARRTARARPAPRAARRRPRSPRRRTPERGPASRTA